METKDRSDHIRSMFRSFFNVDRIHHIVIESASKELGVHRSQLILLLHVDRCEKKPTQTDLCEEFGISPAAIAVTLRKMEARGWVQRSVKDEDCRTKEVTLTPLGKETAVKSKAMMDAAEEAMCKGFTMAEIEAITAYTKRMEENQLAYCRALRAEQKTRT